MGWLGVDLAGRLVVNSIAIGASLYFIWFITMDLTPYFAAHRTRHDETTKMRVCLANLTLAAGWNLWSNTRTCLTVLHPPGDYAGLEARSRERRRPNRPFQILGGGTLAVLAGLSVFYAWRWGDALEAEGEAALSSTCCGLVFYNVAILTVALFELICGCMGPRRAAS